MHNVLMLCDYLVLCFLQILRLDFDILIKNLLFLIYCEMINYLKDLKQNIPNIMHLL